MTTNSNGFRAELRMRRRKSGESVQSVYHDIRRLLALGFPGQSGELCEIIGRDAFLEALGDQALRIRVLDQQPKTLDVALSIVSGMEAYSNPPPATGDEDSGCRKVRVVAAASTPRDTPTVPSVDDRRLQKLEESVANQQREIRQLRSEAAEWKGRAEGANACCRSCCRRRAVDVVAAGTDQFCRSSAVYAYRATSVKRRGDRLAGKSTTRDAVDRMDRRQIDGETEGMAPVVRISTAARVVSVVNEVTGSLAEPVPSTWSMEPRTRSSQ